MDYVDNRGAMEKPIDRCCGKYLPTGFSTALHFSWTVTHKIHSLYCYDSMAIIVIRINTPIYGNPQQKERAEARSLASFLIRPPLTEDPQLKVNPHKC